MLKQYQLQYFIYGVPTLYSHYHRVLTAIESSLTYPTLLRPAESTDFNKALVMSAGTYSTDVTLLGTFIRC